MFAAAGLLETLQEEGSVQVREEERNRTECLVCKHE